MNLEWLIAVLQPHDLFLRTGASSELSEPQRLAAHVLGDQWRLMDHSRVDGTAPGDGNRTVYLAGACFDPETVSDALPLLVDRILKESISDSAELVAASLIASCVSAELELFDLCFEALSSASRQLGTGRSSEVELLQIAIATQISLRTLDAGLPIPEEHQSLLNRLDALDPSALASSPQDGLVDRLFMRTMSDIRDSLLGSVASLVIRRPDESYDDAAVAILAEIQHAPITRNEWRIQQLQAAVLGKHLRTEFERDFQRRTRYVGGSHPDLYHVALLAELSGNQVVFDLRAQLAQLRLVVDLDNARQVGDALRSLRHAASFSDLDLALRRIVDGGPVEAIVQDARRILGNKFRSGRLRTVEAKVVGAAADFLAIGDLELAMSSIEETLTGGGPPDLPFRWQLPVLRRQIVWEAGSAVAVAANLSERWAVKLLSDVRSQEADSQMLDGALAPALSSIDWGSVNQSVCADWRAFVADRKLISCARQLPSLANGRSDPADWTTLDGIIDLLNDSLGGEPFPAEAVGGSRVLIEGLLLGIREQAGRGMFSFGGPSPADVAVGLSIVQGVDLWPSVIDFLVDGSVQQQDKMLALERLARWPGPLDERTRATFRVSADQLLETRSVSAFEPDDLSIFPAALRFLSRHELIERSKVINRIAGMASSRDQQARRESALTLGLLAHVAPSDDLLPYALTLSSDFAPTVRASAGRALASLTLLEGEWGLVAEEKLSVLLSESGVLVPTVLLFGMRESHHEFSTRVMLRLVGLSESHPARSVRREARAAVRAHGVRKADGTSRTA